MARRGRGGGGAIPRGFAISLNNPQVYETDTQQITIVKDERKFNIIIIQKNRYFLVTLQVTRKISNVFLLSFLNQFPITHSSDFR